MGVNLFGYIEFVGQDDDRYQCFAEVNIPRNYDFQALFYKDKEGFPDEVSIWVKVEVYDELHLQQEHGYWMTLQELEEVRVKWLEILIQNNFEVNSDLNMISLKALIAAMKSLENETTRPTRFVYFFS